MRRGRPVLSDNSIKSLPGRAGVLGDWGRAMRQHVFSGSPYEPLVGISRAVRAGAIVTVSGTAPLGPDGRTVAPGDAGAQARRCLEIIKEALGKAGAGLRHVVRTRTLLTRIDDWEKVAAVHGEFFRDIRPANTIMQVVRFLTRSGWSRSKRMPCSMTWRRVRPNSLMAFAVKRLGGSGGTIRRALPRRQSAGRGSRFSCVPSDITRIGSPAVIDSRR
jgi:enamine deaminase RidA (YjgF/YER057c/UK114 family)